jgi:O-antigen/teichoic acid export membrane protein
MSAEGKSRTGTAGLGRNSAVLGFWRSRVVAQAAGFAASQGMVSLLAAVSTVLVARGLSTRDFGAQTFAVSFLVFTSLFFDFGLFLPSGRLVARSSGEGRQRLVGAALMAFVPVGVTFSAAVFALSFGVDTWFHVHAGHALRLISAVAFVYPFGLLSNYLAQGVDRLHIYSITSAGSQALYVVALVVLAATGVKLSVSLVLELRLAGMVVSAIVALFWLSPAFQGSLAHIRQLAHDARAYGFQVYVGRVLSVATYNMDVLMLGALTDAKTVGYYGLAGSAAYAVGLPAYGMSAALFSRMTSAAKLDSRWLVIAWTTGLGGAALATVLAHPLVPLVFSHRYSRAIGLIPPLALAEAVRGATTVYNSFLSAQGRGKALRNAALILTVSNLILNFALIPPFGALGAAWASLAALVANLIAHVVFYRRSLPIHPPTPAFDAGATL